MNSPGKAVMICEINQKASLNISKVLIKPSISVINRLSLFTVLYRGKCFVPHTEAR
jgi:hypothetical protein